MYGNHGNRGRCVKGGALAMALSKQDCTESLEKPKQNKRQIKIKNNQSLSSTKSNIRETILVSKIAYEKAKLLSSSVLVV